MLKKLLFDLLNLLQQEQKKIMAIIICIIWTRRKKRIWDNVELPFSIFISSSSFQFFEEWKQERNVVVHSTRATQFQHDQQWKALTQGWLKMNIDAEIFCNRQCFGIGLCIWDCQGRFIKAITQKMNGVPLSKEVDAWGLLLYQNVISELDC